MATAHHHGHLHHPQYHQQSHPHQQPSQQQQAMLHHPQQQPHMNPHHHAAAMAHHAQYPGANGHQQPISSSAAMNSHNMASHVPQQHPQIAARQPPPPSQMAPNKSTLPASILHSLQKLASANEQTWLHIGSMSETVGEYERAMSAYENALRNNPYSVPALTQIAALCRAKEQYPKAVEYFQRILNIDGNNGEIWGALGHCYLMIDDLPKAYNCYQQALVHLPNPKEPKLWYGIGILYDRYGSFDHAEEAFTSVIKMDPNFEKSNEIYFRLGIIYKQQGKYDSSLQCFRYIKKNPPKPLTEVDIQFQIGHVYEFQGDFTNAKEAYENVLKENPNHAKVLRQLGWLFHQPNNFTSQDTAISFLTKSLKIDANDAQSWYLLGRCYMAQKNHNKAYESYQQAVYRDGSNPIFWCSIGVLYFQIGQFRDALDAYTRAIRINPYMPEVWINLGVLYESCNNQMQDATDAYTRAQELDPKNIVITNRLKYLASIQSNGGKPPGSPVPAPTAQDINPNNYRHGFPGQQVPPPLGRGNGPLQVPNGASSNAGPLPFQTAMNGQGGPGKPMQQVPLGRPLNNTSPSQTPQIPQPNTAQHALQQNQMHTQASSQQPPFTDIGSKQGDQLPRMSGQRSQVSPTMSTSSHKSNTSQSMKIDTVREEKRSAEDEDADNGNEEESGPKSGGSNSSNANKKIKLSPTNEQQLEEDELDGAPLEDAQEDLGDQENQDEDEEADQEDDDYAGED